MANTFVSLRRLQRFYDGLKNKFALKSDIKTPDWNAQAVTDETSGETTYEDGYIENKPPVYNGSNIASILVNKKSNSYYQSWDLHYVSPSEATTTITFTLDDPASGEIPTVSNSSVARQYILQIHGSREQIREIVSIDSQSFTITLGTEIGGSSSAGELKSATLHRYYKYANYGGSAFGGTTIAAESFSAAFGEGTKALGAFSFASGQYSKAKGPSSHAEGNSTQAIGTNSHSEGSSSKANAAGSHAEGVGTTADALYSHAEGYSTISGGAYSHAEGLNTLTLGIGSHAEGNYSVASGLGSHAEGYKYYYKINISGEPNATVYNFTNNFSSIGVRNLKSPIVKIITKDDTSNFHQYTSVYSKITNVDFENLTITVDSTLSSEAITNVEYYIHMCTTSSGYASHAEGESTVASNDDAHTEGIGTIASGKYSHAEGKYTTASAESSHASGEVTTASTRGQMVIGTYNIPDNTEVNLHPSQYDGFGKYAFIVGNGYDEGTESNAHTLDWSGNSWYAGTVSAGTIASPATVTNNNDLTTKAYVDNAVTSLNFCTESEINEMLAAIGVVVDVVEEPVEDTGVNE